MAPKPIREEARTVGIPSIAVKAANSLRIKSVNGVFALTLTRYSFQFPPTLFVLVAFALYLALNGTDKNAMLIAIAFVGLFVVLDLSVFVALCLELMLKLSTVTGR